MYTFQELPGAQFASLAAVLEHAPTALAIEEAIALFDADRDEDALLVELHALSFTWDEVAAIIASGGRRPRVGYYVAGDHPRRPGKRTERLVINVHA